MNRKGTNMDRFENTNIESEKAKQESRILEYPAVVDTVKVSLARQLHVAGALEARTFQEVLMPLSPSLRQHIEEQISARFDDELVYYITCLMILSENRSFTIRAEVSEGFDGHLPWQAKLEEAVKSHDRTDDLPGAHITIERYKLPSTVEVLEEQTAQPYTALGERALSQLAA